MDVGRRFNIDPQRVYLAGMSGGARVATGIALGNRNIAGVIASSAGYPDSQPRASVSFAIFGTAGTEDFNYIEMRLLDRKLTSPHFLAVFQGGHSLPPDDVAAEVAGHFDDLRGWLTATLAAGEAQGTFRLSAPAPTEAAALMATVHGAMLSSRAFGDAALFPAIVLPAIERLATKP